MCDDMLNLLSLVCGSLQPDDEVRNISFHFIKQLKYPDPEVLFLVSR